MISLIKQEYIFLEKIDKNYGFCENNGYILLYKKVFYKYYIFAPPDWFIEEIHKNQNRLKTHKQLKILYLDKNWKIDETKRIINL